MSHWSRTFYEALLLLVCGLLLGLMVNHRLVLAASSGRVAAPVKVVESQQAHLPQPALLAEVRDLVGSGALPVDARDATLYAEAHLPGALSLPLGEVETLLPQFRQRAAARTLVVYCNGYGCPDSFDLGVRLLAEGFADVRVFEGGLPEWRDAGLPVATGMQ